MRKIFVASGVFILILILLFSCAPKPTPAPTPTPAVKPTPTPVVKPRVLKFATLVSPKHHSSKVMEFWFIPEIEKRTGGRIKIEYYPGQALGKAKEHYELARKGIADISTIVQGYTPGMFPLSSGIELPFLFKTGVQGSKIFQELGRRGWFDKEYKGVKVISLFTTSSYHLFMTKKRVERLEDIKGLKIRSFGGYCTPLIEKLGAAPVFVSSPELYLALQRGTVDGTFFMCASGVISYKFHEICKYLIKLHAIGAGLGLLMNEKVWNELPPDIQKIFLDVGEELTVKVGESYDTNDRKGEEIAREAGMEIIELPPAEKQKWIKAAAPLYEEWVKEMEGKGLPAREFMKDLIETAKKYGLTPPYEIE